MEKFRHFGDAATGIHPFTFVIAPTPVGRILATVMFPMRLLFSSVFCLLLLLTDTLLWVLYCAYLPLLGKLLLAPLQRAWLRGLLFFIGHILPEAPATLNQPNRPASPTTTPRQLRGGDLVVCNCQSVWDGAVLEVMLAQPFHAICFPDATVTGDTDHNNKKSTATPGVRVFWPGPLQRWRVWSFVRRTGRLDFVTAQQPLFDITGALRGSATTTSAAAAAAAAKKADGAALQLCAVQEAAARAGVPVWWFGEGTCSNGKGLLPMPFVVCRTAASAPSAAECTVYLATLTYDSPALQNVLGNDVEGFFSMLFRTSSLLYGSTAPAWSSPFFPTAEVTFRPAKVTRATTVVLPGPQPGAVPVTYWTFTTAALLELRNAMCQRGQALVVSSSSGSGAAVRRQPLSVGVKEKKGFVEAYIAMLQKA